MAKSVGDSLAMVAEFLGEIRKEAAVAPTDPEATQPGAASKMDSVSITELTKEKPASSTQTNLGKEQSAEANAGGSNVDAVPANTDEDGTDMVDEETPKKLDVDQPVRSNSEVIGDIKTQEINMEQKLARTEKLASAILQTISNEFGYHKTASANTAEGRAMEKIAERARAYAQDAYHSYIAGCMTRIQDEYELKEANIKPEILSQFGGVSGLLDKVAEENVEAILPPEMAAEGEMPTGGGEAEAVLEEIVTALDEAGVSPEDLEQAFADVQALEEAGVQPEELAQAIEEMSAEAPVEDAGEAPVMEAPAADAEKMANSRERIGAIKKFLGSR